MYCLGNCVGFLVGDIVGKLIYSELLEQGLNSIDIHDLKQKKIILSFETQANNKISTKKIIVP